MRLRTVASLVALVLMGLGLEFATSAKQPTSSSYLFVWATEREHNRYGRDFLAVFDVAPKSPTYGRLVTILPVGNAPCGAHHTNNEMPAGGMLFANDFCAGKTFIFDLRDPTRPRLAASFGAVGDYTHPHSFVRLSNGDTLATFQQRGSADAAAGALVELDASGRLVRASRAADPQVAHFIRPYGLQIVPALDRVVTSSTDMYNEGQSRVLQVWRLSDLKLLKTIALPSSEGDPRVAAYTSEPRLLSDGHTVLVPTFNCGLYRIDGLAGINPSAHLIYDFGGRDCAVPVVAGHFWIEASQSSHSIVSLDVTDPSHPIEVGELDLGFNNLPHWLALEPEGNRIVITGFAGLATRMLIAIVNLHSGHLTLDERFREPSAKIPGFSFDRDWPDGWKGTAYPHGAVFSRP